MSKTSGSPVSGAEGFTAAVSSENITLGKVIRTLDSYSIDIGKSDVSLWDGIMVIFVIISMALLAYFTSKLSHYLLKRISGLDEAQKLLTDKLASIAVWTIAILIGIDFLGIDLTALAVFSGAFGLAIGFGLQKTLGNLIAGIILLMDRSIKPGDVIAVSDMSGRESFGQIRKIGMRAISVTTRDMKEYLIPNENLMVNQVENWSYSTRNVRVKVPVPVAFGTDLELAEKLMMQATQSAARVLEIPEPKVLLMDFGEHRINFEIRFWIVDPEEGIGAVCSDVLKGVWRLFGEHGISIPYPQRDIHIKDSAQLDELIAAIARRQAEKPGG